MPRTVTIRIKTNKNGRRVAHYWGVAKRWLPMPVETAEIAIATGAWGNSKAVAHDALP